MCARPRRRYVSPVGTLSSSQFQTIVVISFLLSLAAAPASSSSSNTDFQTLLCLKLQLSNTPGLLDSWMQNNSLHFCTWPGVTCSKAHTSRVVALDLENYGLNGQIPPCIANLTLLSRIHFPGNQLSGQIPPELGQLRRLRYLNLSSNSLIGSIPDTISSTLLLQVIDLGSNKLSGNIPEVLGMLHNLSVLHLPLNSLSGNIPHSLGSSSSSLVSVVLANNSLTGPIPLALANSSSLQELNLVRNYLGGEIPPALFNSTSLEKLALGWNNFAGSIPDLSNINNSPLQSLVLSVNRLAGTIPSSLGNFSSLRTVLLAANYFQGSVPVSISKIPNLQVLDISYNRLSGIVPAPLYNVSSLTYLSLAVNEFTGDLPLDIGYTLPRIQTLILQQNQFQGQIPPLANATNFEYINLGANSFHGIIPSFGSLANLNELILASNLLEAGDWSFLSALRNCTQLEVLSLATNIMQGKLPDSIGSLAKSLRVIFLHANKISGTIPAEIGNLTNLAYLRMEQNYIAGDLPDTIGNLANLTILILSQNKLSGQIPLSIGKLQQLNELYLQENNLSGPIPRAIGDCQNLIALNLSCNTLNESIPKELFSINSLTAGLDLSHNQLSGQIPQEIGRLINIGPLNFSNNHLSGLIPTTIGACVRLESLRMAGNSFYGQIPESFINLGGVAEIDLSRNNLSGEIPKFFESFNSLKLLNLSFNNLEGPMPTGGIFQNTSEVFVQGNIMLCSNSPMLQLPLCITSSKHRRTSHILKIIGICVALALVSLSCVTFILLKRRKRSKQSDQPSFKELKNFSYADLVKVTNGFSSNNLIGSGAYGSVYKGVLESEAHGIAVKVFKLDQLGAPKSFLAECEAFRNTRHRNLVRVISACSTWDHSGNDFKAIILEYMANGNLESWLYSGTERPLSLGSRATIAVDIASALDYLHNHCMPPMVHCDLKPSNVLLDETMGARLSDFGLAKFLHCYSSSSITSSTSLAGPRGSIGYIAPEYGFGSKISTEGDVYSYGIIILELITGKRPTDALFNDGLSLHKFVANAFPKKIHEILDPSIIPMFGDKFLDNNPDHGNHATVGMQSYIMQLIKLGLSCSMESPKERPTMQDVYAEVSAIKRAFLALRVEGTL